MHFDTRKIITTFAYTLVFVALLMLPSLIYASIYKDRASVSAFFIPATISLFVGFIILFLTRKSEYPLNTRNGYMCLIVAVFTAIIIGAVPYQISIHGSNFANAIFESTAGFTTTTATVYGEPTLSKALLIWKTIQHWIGGAGILIFLVGYYPYITKGTERISTIEGNKYQINKVDAKLTSIIKKVLLVYTALTIIAFMYYSFADTSIFEAFVLSLTSVCTSAVFTHPEGLAFYNSAYIEFGTVIFSILTSINFIVYLRLSLKHINIIFKNIEIRVFIIMILGSSIIVTIALLLNGNYGTNVPDVFLKSLVQVSSFATTSGFAIVDYTLWPSFCIFILIYLMFIGGCSASTTGSFKVIRVLVAFKLISRGITKRIHPNAVAALRLGYSNISSKIVNAVIGFSFLYLATIFVSLIILSIQNLDMNSTFGATIGMLSNSGITIGDVGITGNYSMFYPFLQIFLSLLMIIGKIGVLSTLIFLLPSFWNPNKRKII
ncbi:MAG: potassium transporter TrkG [Eubacteriales bacterium]|nr:potassium transporter TrkG [Eubacteriales bacterium]MDY3333280.1 potassium transporter TrkG [Gallibacter sp.]